MNPVNSKERFNLTQKDIIQIPNGIKRKLGSGHLLLQASKKIKEKNMLAKVEAQKVEGIFVIIYLKDYPNPTQINSLEQLGIECYLDSWTPKLNNHPFGLFIAKLPAEQLIKTMSLDFVELIETAEMMSHPENNNAYKAINADDVWKLDEDGNLK